MPISGIAPISAVACAALTGLALISVRRVRYLFTPFVLLAAVSVALGLGVQRAVAPLFPPIQTVAAVAACVALLVAVVARAADLWLLRSTRSSMAVVHLKSLSLGVSLLSAVAAVMIEVVLLAARVVDLAVDLSAGTSLLFVRSHGYDHRGLSVLLVVFSAGVLSLRLARTGALAAPLFWLCQLIVGWASLLTPTYRMAADAAPHRTPSTLVLLVGMSVVLALGALVHARVARREGCTPVQVGERAPGFPVSCEVVCNLIVLLTFYHAAVPVDVVPGGFRLTAVLCTLCPFSALCSMYLLSGGAWRHGSGHALVALAATMVCVAPMILVPVQPAALAARCPIIFTALITGAAGATVLATATARGLLAGGWISKRLHPWSCWAKCISMVGFLAGCFGLLLSIIMTVWPRLPSIVVSDDSIGRIGAGVAANVGLMLAILWSANRQGRRTWYLLALFSGLTTVGFVVIRLLPFSGSVV